MNFEHILVHELAGEDEEEFIVCGDYTLDLDELVAMDILPVSYTHLSGTAPGMPPPNR